MWNPCWRPILCIPNDPSLFDPTPLLLAVAPITALGRGEKDCGQAAGWSLSGEIGHHKVFKKPNAITRMWIIGLPHHQGILSKKTQMNSHSISFAVQTWCTCSHANWLCSINSQVLRKALLISDSWGRVESRLAVEETKVSGSCPNCATLSKSLDFSESVSLSWKWG